MEKSNLISQFITALNKAELYPDSEELADVLWLALQIDIPVIQNKSDFDNEEVISKQENDNKPPLDNQNLPEKPPEKSPEIESTKQSQQQSSLFPHQQNSGINPGGMKGQAFRTPALSLLHNALAFNRAFRPLRKIVASRFHTELDIEETVQYIAETHIFSPVLKGKPERWLELVIIIDDAVSMRIWQPLLKEFRRLLELQGTFTKIHFYQLDTENDEARVLKNNRVIKNFEIINTHQPRLILVLSDCVAKAWHSNNGVFNLLQKWSQKHPVSIMQMLPYRLWKGTALGYTEEARFTAPLPLALNKNLNIDAQDFWFIDDISELQKGFKIPVLTLEPEIVKTWAKLVLGKKDSWLKGVVFENKTVLIPPLEQEPEKTVNEITAEQRIKQFKSFASPMAQQLAAYLATVPLDLSVMNVVQKLMLPQSQQVHLAEVFLGGLLKRESDSNWVEYDFHAGVRELLLDTVIVADAVFVLTRVSDFVEQRFGQSLDFLALLANPSLTDGIDLNESTRPFAEVGAKILRRLGGEYEALAERIVTGDISNPVKPNPLELALQLIAENKKTCATFLDLGNCGLTEIPDEIGELEWLEELSFASEWWGNGVQIKSQNQAIANNIRSLNGLKRLTKIKKLWLRNNNLTDLSPLASLTALQTLDIYYTKVSDLSPLSSLMALQILDIYYTKVSDLSPLAGLTDLHSLNISSTPISDLSPLANLTALQTLNISSTPISELRSLVNFRTLQSINISSSQVNDLSPLTGLTTLQALDISNIKVSDLTPLVGLTALQSLHVSYTKITNINPLASLTALQTLNISNSQVSDLSPVADLTALQILDISNTKISDLRSLASLRALQLINISSSQVSDLSPLLSFIKKGLPVKWSSSFWENSNSGIYVENCHLTNPPVAIVKQGNEAILNYFKEQQSQGTDHLYEAKLLLVGAGGAGKTSLVRRLYQANKPLPKPEDNTKGIDIYRHEFTVQDSRYPNGRTFRLNVWDFAGQDKYRPTDTFFFSPRSLYVLLDDTRNDDKTVHDAGFKYWLEAVDFFSDHSPVLIFQNERAGRNKNIDFAGIQRKFNVKACYKGDLNKPDAVDGLRAAIEFYAKQLPHIGEELPALWLKIRADIEQLAQQQTTISVQDYFALYKKHLPFDRDKALYLSRYLHDLGVFLHYQDDELLSRTVILQNQWATEAVFKILDDETVKAELGRFTTADCQRLWQDSDYADLHPELHALMEKFELCYLLPDSNPKTWLAPQLLPASKPAELSDWAKAGDLVLRYQYEFLPKGMISRLMVRLYRFVLHPDLNWLTGVLFERDSTQVLVELSPQGNEIVLRARGLERKELLSVIEADLDALNATFTSLSEKIKVMIPCCCKRCKEQKQPEAFEQKQLLKRKQDGKLTIECPASYENVNILELLDGIQTKELPSWSKEYSTMKKIFISYSKHDKRYKDTLLKHLEGLRGNMITWNDADLLAGEDWDERIKEELEQADIVLYLVSANSMATGYIQNVELPFIKERCERGECKLVPIIVSSCHWINLDFAKKNALPNKGVPVKDKSWGNQNEAWITVIQQLEKIV